jgi:hypothetical protein
MYKRDSSATLLRATQVWERMTMTNKGKNGKGKEKQQTNIYGGNK